MKKFLEFIADNYKSLFLIAFAIVVFLWISQCNRKNDIKKQLKNEKLKTQQNMLAINDSIKKYKNIIYKGFQKSLLVPLYLKAADILVIPTSKKYIIGAKYTSPLKLFEYMASKRPIIASDLPSIRNIVSEKEMFFFKPDNANDLSKKIEILLKDEAKQKNLTENAFKKVKKYTWKKRAEKIINLFNVSK